MVNSINSNSPLILIADDDQTTRKLLRMILRKDRYQVAEVTNGQECLQAYHDLQPNLILLDAIMPVMDGFQCCAAIQKIAKKRQTPILMITGLEDQHSVDRAFTVGAIDYITKPIHPPLLRQRLRRILQAVKAEEDLKESEKKYRSVVNNLKEVIFQIDKTGRFLFLNPAWTQITGFSIRETLGKSFWQFIHPDDRQIHAKKFGALLEIIARELINKNLASWEFAKKYLLNSSQKNKGNALTLLKINYRLLTMYTQSYRQDSLREDCRYQVRYLKKNDGVGWIEIYAYLTFSEDNLISGISGTINDITERKTREKYLETGNLTRKILAESTSISEANTKIIQSICENLNWDWGEICLIDRDDSQLSCQHIWYDRSKIESKQLKLFQWLERGNLAKKIFIQGDLAGYILNLGEAIWVSEIVSKGMREEWLVNIPMIENQQESWRDIVVSFPGKRSKLLAKMGIKSAFGLPMFTGEEKLGILCFYSLEVQDKKLELLKNIIWISSEIGQFICRKKAEEEVKHQNQILQSELKKAADYVRSLLPNNLEQKKIKIEQQFIPSCQLGGDAFDYYWLDKNHLAIYLLDVAGHGIKSALLSISVLNILRSQSLYNTDFYQPWSVLEELNRVFQMNEDGSYFTIWYGVYDIRNRHLVYAGAGHPPAILISEVENGIIIEKLAAYNVPIGMLSDFEFDDQICDIPSKSSLYIFSDGIYELDLGDGKIWGLNALIDLISEHHQLNQVHLNKLIDSIKEINSHRPFNDDVSLLKIDL